MSRTVLVTGASRGIGAATAKLFAARGDNVIINYFSSEASALSLARSLTNSGCTVALANADVSIRSEVDRMVDSALKRFGTIDVLINNAGIAEQKLFTDITQKDWERMIDVNLTGIFNCTQAILKEMIRKKSGSIINVSSVWGISGASCEVHYSASKSAIIGLTKALAKEVGPSGIRVNCVAPGVIDTDMNSNLTLDDLAKLADDTPLSRLGTPEDVAQLIYFLCSDNASFITGQVIGIDGGFAV